MKKPGNSQSLSLFYSYSHKDRHHRERMEQTLTLLRKNGGLVDWSDEAIVPGTDWSEEIRAQLEAARIIVFLVSIDFVASDVCLGEWETAIELAKESDRYLIPVILQNCPWADVPGMGGRQALPKGAKPISSYENEDDAWMEVYDGIKRTMEEASRKVVVQSDFVDEVSQVEFLINGFNRVELDQLFVFPVIRVLGSGGAGESVVGNAEKLLRYDHLLLCGAVLGGKSALCTHLFRKLVNAGEPGILVSLNNIRDRRASERVYRDTFRGQFTGSFDQWSAGRTTVILDDFSSSSRDVEHLRYCMTTFDRVIVSMVMDIYVSFYHHENSPFAAFDVAEIGPLSHIKQSALIEKWLDLSRTSGRSHGEIDRLEEEVNGIIVDNRILPRYPHFVLSILQMRERFMPRDTTITSYGHCHYVLILAHLIKAGSSKRDSEISTCMNVCCHFAYFSFRELSMGKMQTIGEERFGSFWEEYRSNYVVSDSTLKRVRHPDYGVLRGTGFRADYMYWYFLGKYLADNRDEPSVRDEINLLIENIDQPDSCFALMSVVHHCGDLSIVQGLLEGNRRLAGSLQAARLEYTETEAISALLHGLPRDLLEDEPDVEAGRLAEREARDVADGRMSSTEKAIQDSGDEAGLRLYRMLKSIDVLSQVVRNRFGVINKAKLTEILEVIVDTGLGVVRGALWDEERIGKFAREVHRRSPEVPMDKICVLTAMILIGVVVALLNRVSDTISKDELRELVSGLLGGSPARELIAYINWLRVKDRFRSVGGGKGADVDHVVRLLDEAANEFVWWATSLVTQKYLLTHRAASQSVQAIREAIRKGPRRKVVRKDE